MADITMKVSGFDELFKQLEKISGNAEKVAPILEVGAEALVKDVRALPSPRSTINHTHLLDTVSHKVNGDEVEVGWGLYYGPFVERGTRKMGARPHVRPTFKKNQKKYYKLMQDKLLGK